jgi:mono/diheme cytochrome c family protein
MRTRTFSFQLILSAAVVVFLATAAYCQQTEYSENQRLNMESHIDGMTGHATTGQPTYKRFCIGCHGSLGDGQGENAQWIDPKPRNFTIAIFRCRSTPTGTLPTDTDLYVKHFSPRWLTEQPGTPIVIPPEPAVTAERIKEGRVVFQRLECWKCHGVTGQGNGPSADTLVDDENRPIKPFNFHDSQKFKCGSSDQAMYKDFMTGLDGSPMPSFSDNLKPEEAWSLVFYLRTLQPDNTPEKQIAKQLGLTPINPLEPLPSSDSGQQAPSSDQGTNPASQPAQPNNSSPAPTQPASPATPPSTTPPPSNNSGNE